MGHFRFRLLACLALLAAGSPGAAEALRFQPGRACKLTPGVAHVYSFALKKGDFQEIVFDQRGADVEFEVVDPRGGKVVTVNSLNGKQGPEDVSWVAAVTGKYQVRVSGEPGTYVTRTALHRRAMPQDRDRATAAVAYSEGKELKRLKKTREAEAKFRDAARLAGRGKDRLREADAWNQLGVLYCEGNRWVECSDSCSRALSIYDALGQYVPAVLGRMATALHYLDEPKQETAVHERFIHLAHELGRAEDEANARLRLGDLQLAISKIDQALANLREAARLYHQQSKPADEARALISCGRAYSKIGEFDQALAVQGEALTKLRRGKDDSLIASTFSHLGDTYREAGQSEQAVSYYRRSLGISHRRKDLVESEAATSNQLGLAYLRLKNYAKAESYYGQLKQITATQENKLEAMRGLSRPAALAGSGAPSGRRS